MPDDSYSETTLEDNSIALSQDLDRHSESDEDANAGRWTAEEHEKFLEGYKMFGRDWKTISKMIGTRTNIQCRTHAQKCFKREERQREKRIAVAQDQAEQKPAKRQQLIPSPRGVDQLVAEQGNPLQATCASVPTCQPRLAFQDVASRPEVSTAVALKPLSNFFRKPMLNIRLTEHRQRSMMSPRYQVPLPSVPPFRLLPSHLESMNDMRGRLTCNNGLLSSSIPLMPLISSVTLPLQQPAMFPLSYPVPNQYPHYPMYALPQLYANQTQ